MQVKRMLLPFAALITAGALGTASASVAAAEPRTEARYIAANCANCHGHDGRAVDAMPQLAGMQKSYMVEQMQAYKTGKRPGTIMHQIAKGYTDAQIEMLADYFSRQQRAQ